MPKSIEDEKSCQILLKECEMFHRLSAGQIETLAKNMNVRSLHRNQTFVHQGNPVTAFYLVKDAEIYREFLDPDTGKRHSVEFEIKTHSINTMRVLSGDPAQNSAKCKRSTCNIFEMPRQRLLACLNERPDIGVGIANSLSSHVRETSKKYRTPLLEQRQQIIQNMPAVMVRYISYYDQIDRVRCVFCLLACPTVLRYFSFFAYIDYPIIYCIISDNDFLPTFFHSHTI